MKLNITSLLFSLIQFNSILFYKSTNHHRSHSHSRSRLYSVYTYLQRPNNSTVFVELKTTQKLNSSISHTGEAYYSSWLISYHSLQCGLAISFTGSDKFSVFSIVLSQDRLCWRIYSIIGFSPHVHCAICCLQLNFEQTARGSFEVGMEGPICQQQQTPEERQDCLFAVSNWLDQ